MEDKKDTQDKVTPTKDIVINIKVEVNGLEEIENITKLFNDLKNVKRQPNIW